MQEKQGVWVFQAGVPLKTTIRIVRNEREQQVSGRKR